MLIKVKRRFWVKLLRLRGVLIALVQAKRGERVYSLAITAHATYWEKELFK
jgi:hypothetical protein